MQKNKIKMATCKLSQGLISRLDSANLSLEDKSRLAMNVFTCRVNIPGKHQIVLGWIMKLLEIKHTQRMACSGQDREESQEKIWNILEVCLEYLEDNKKKVALESSAIPEFLLNILPHLDLANEKTSTIISRLIFLFFTPNLEIHLWRQLVLQLLKSNSCTPLLAPTVVNLLEQLQLTTQADSANIVYGLGRLYSQCDTELQSRIIGITERILFPDGEDYSPLFQLLHGNNLDVKYQPTGAVAVFVSCMKPLLPDSLSMVVRSCGKMGSELKVKILSLGLWLMGQDQPSLIDTKSVLGGRLVRMRVGDDTSVDKRLDVVAGIMEAALPVDITEDLKEDLPVSKYLISSAKFWFDKCSQLTPPLARLVKSFSTHHPHLLEPIIGQLLIKYLNSTSSPTEVFSELLGIMVQMRQLPKMFVRLLLQLRQLEFSLQGGWTPSDLEQLSAAVTQLPRVQCLELWKTLLYHLSSDGLANVAYRPVIADNMASVVGPAISTLLQSAQLVDHNLPSNLQMRIVGLANDTLSQILEPIAAMEEVPNTFRIVLYQVTFSLTELSSLMLTYRRMEGLSRIFSFQDSLVSIICKSSIPETDLSRNLLAQRLKLCTMDNLDLVEIMTKCDKLVLQNNLAIFQLVVNEVPSPVLMSLYQPALLALPGLADEYPRISAAVISDVVTQLKITALADRSDLWLDPGNWEAIDEDLGRKVVNCCMELEKEAKEDDLDANILDKVAQVSILPVENLPTVLKLGATLISVTLFNRSRDYDPPLEICQLLARCLETTDLFRYISGASFYIKLAKVNLPESPLFETVAASLVRFTKTIQDVEACLEELEMGVAEESAAIIKAAAVLLVALARPLGQSGLAKKKRAAGENVANRLTKSLAKVAKKVGMAPGEGGTVEEWCIAAAAAVVKIYGKELGKLSKLVTRMFNSALYLVSSGNHHALNLLTEVSHHTGLCARFPEDWRVSTWSQVTSAATSDIEQLLPSLLASAKRHELAQMLADLSKATLSGNLPVDRASLFWQHVVSAEVEEESFPARLAAVELVLPHLFSHATNILDLINSIVSSTPPVISSSAETSCITHIVSMPATPKTLTSLHLFLTHRPNQAVRLLPTVTGLIRRFLDAIKTSDVVTNKSTGATDSKVNCSVENAIILADGLERLLGLASRRKEDWARVAPYVLADTLHTFQLAQLDPRVKTALVQCCHNMLDMCDRHSVDYVAANLPTGTKEIFKHVLHNYNTQHKFTGRV